MKIVKTLVVLEKLSSSRLDGLLYYIIVYYYCVIHAKNAISQKELSQI